MHQALWDDAPVGLCVVDRRCRVVMRNNWAGWAEAGAWSATPLGALAEAADTALARALRQVMASRAGIAGLELTFPAGGLMRAWQCNLAPLGEAGDPPGEVAIAVFDVTARALAEAASRTLSHEVDHRGQNVLSIARGLVRLAAAQAPPDAVALAVGIGARLAGMSRVHNVLARERWVSAEMRDIVEAELQPFGTQAVASGPALRLTPEAALAFAVVLHEVASNAVTHGALARDTGRASLRWARVADGVEVTWGEVGGPPLSRVPAPGFGTELVDATVRSQLAGTIERRWEADGFRCVLRLGAAVLAGDTSLAQAGALVGRRVLLAIEDADVLAMLAGALRAAGCEPVPVAGSLVAAIAGVERGGGFDAVVLAPTLGGCSTQPLAEVLRRRTIAMLHLAEGATGLAPAGDGPVAELFLDAPLTRADLCDAVMRALPRLLSAVAG